MYPMTLRVFMDGSFQIMNGIYVLYKKSKILELPCGNTLTLACSDDAPFLLEPTHTQGYILQGPLDIAGVPQIAGLTVFPLRPTHRVLLYVESQTYPKEFFLRLMGPDPENQDAVNWLYSSNNRTLQKHKGLVILEPTDHFGFMISGSSYPNPWVWLKKDQSTGKPILKEVADFYKGGN